MDILSRQGGQALIEALVVVGVLASAWVAVTWVGRLQDASLQAAHASRHQAFAYAYQGMDAQLVGSVRSHYFFGAGQRWGHRHGDALVEDMGSRIFQVSHIPDYQAGGPSVSAQAARRELALGDEAIWISQARLSTIGVPQVEGTLRDFDLRKLRLTRHTAILRGSGAAIGDAQVQAVLADADTLWATAASRSAWLAHSADTRLRPIDASWNRPGLQTDWLTPWTGWVPASHLRAGGTP